jgi:tetratricopeptide (TPR) repeat protein
LANAQDAAGQVKEARATLAEFEKLAIAPETSTDNSKLDLILLYAGSAESAPTALKLGQHEISVRQDVWTLDAYAWALYANGQYQEAAGEVDKAIAVGIESAQIFNHAGHIAQKLNKSAEAQKYFQLSVRSNPSSEFALDARKFVSPDTFAHGGSEGYLKSNAPRIHPWTLRQMETRT